MNNPESAIYRAQAESALLVALSELRRPNADLDNAFEHTDKACSAIETLRILQEGAARRALLRGSP